MLFFKNVFKLPSKKAASQGFTLLEVMISVSILALVLVALFRMQSGSVLLAQANLFNLTAPSLAEKLLSEIENDLEDWSQTQGEFDAPFSGISWTCQIETGILSEMEDVSDEMGDRFKRIHIEIRNESGREYQLTTWRLADE